MLPFRVDVQRQPAVDHQYQRMTTQTDHSQNAPKVFAWESESGDVFRQNTVHRHMHASSVSSQSSPRLPDSVQCYTEPIPRPAQVMDPMDSSNGPYYGPNTSRASSTLPSPSPMTPNTEDMFQQYLGRRRPSDFATSAAPSLFSPRSPRDYDFPTGKHLPYMDGSHQHQPGADFFSEAFNPHPAPSHPGQGSLAVDLESGIAMSGPPYPPQIVGPHGGVPYLDPHVLNTSPEGAYNQLAEMDPLGVEYGADDYQTASPDYILHSNQEPPQETEYGDTSDHVDAHPSDVQNGDIQGKPRPTKNSTVPKVPTHHASQHRKASQHLLGRRSSNPIRVGSRTQNQCDSCDKHFDSATKLRKHTRKEHIRPYPCIFAQYGCKSVFGTKNEWSRHVKVQHLRLETWRCNIGDCEKYVRDEDQPPLPPSSKGKSEYDRKDLFLNHVRRCHKERYPKPGITEGPLAANYEEQAQQRCHQDLRSSPPESLCNCCSGVVWPDFDARLEHVGRAMENNEDARDGFYDHLLEGYMIQEGLLCRDGERWLLTGAEGKKGGRQARRPAQRSLTIQTPLSSTTGRHEPSVQPSRKSKRVALKMQQLSRHAKQEENSEDDAEAEADEDYAV